jgi:hypothetical protein
MTGQTIASGRGGQAFGTVEAQLKQDRLDAACAFVARVINRQLIPSILTRNYGDTDEPPSCRFLQETEGTYQDAQRDQILSSLGLPIPLSHLRQKYNIPEPTGEEEVTEPPPKPMAPSDVSAGPKGTRPIGQTPNGNSPSEKPRQVEAKLEALSLIQDDEIFARELRRLASELVTGYDPSEPRAPAGTAEGGQWTDEGSSTGRKKKKSPKDESTMAEIEKDWIERRKQVAMESGKFPKGVPEEFFKRYAEFGSLPPAKQTPYMQDYDPAAAYAARMSGVTADGLSILRAQAEGIPIIKPKTP